MIFTLKTALSNDFCCKNDLQMIFTIKMHFIVKTYDNLVALYVVVWLSTETNLVSTQSLTLN